MKTFLHPFEFVVRLWSVTALLGVAGFCAFGFWASFEPGPDALLYKIGYAGLGCGCLAGAMFLLRQTARKRRTGATTTKATLVCAGLLFPLACAVGKDLDSSDLEGTWNLVYQERGGKKLPDEAAAEMFHGKMVFKDGDIRYTVELPGFDVRFSYVLHTNQQPTGIDLKVKETPDGKGNGQVLLGICRLEGETLNICYNTAKRPTSFSAAGGSDNVLIVLKKRQLPKHP